MHYKWENQPQSQGELERGWRGNVIEAIQLFKGEEVGVCFNSEIRDARRPVFSF